MAPKSSNGNTITSTNHINVDFKFVEDADKTWVDQDKFWECSNDYEQYQDNISLSTSSEVQFKIRTTLKTWKQEF